MMSELTVSLISPMLSEIAEAAIINDSRDESSVPPAKVCRHETRNLSNRAGTIFTMVR
jgi:hypothetical protein